MKLMMNTTRERQVHAPDEMLELARRNAASAGATNVSFLRGTIRVGTTP